MSFPHYVTDDYGYRYQSAPTVVNGLIENIETAGNSYLFPTIEDAENHLKKN